jgi:polyisoprenoid-binding protein YceI
MALRVDTTESVVNWRGTKFAGRGKHEGIVRLASGALDLCEGALWGGRFVLDMRTIEVTDIPVSDPIPRARLRNHLMSDDFFAVETYPEATFEIRRVDALMGDSLQVLGTLTMRGVSEGIAFGARVSTSTASRLHARAQFTLDRQRWGVAFRGDALTNDLVDDAIALDIDLHASR